MTITVPSRSRTHESKQLDTSTKSPMVPSTMIIVLVIAS